MSAKSFKINMNDLIVSPNGNDTWSGRKAEPDKENNDGPLASIRKAIQIIRNWRHQGKLGDTPTVWCRGGIYSAPFPFEIEPMDSNIKFQAWPDEEPIVDGGIRIKKWDKCEINGNSAIVADVKNILLEYESFNSFFVNGQRCRRSRYPEKGYLYVDSVPDQSDEASSSDVELYRGNMRVKAADGDLDNITKWDGAEMVLLNRWIIERLPIASYESDSKNVNFKVKTRFCIRSEFKGDDGPKTNRYYLENVKEGVLSPGDWYVDNNEAKLYYIPREGETAENIEAVVPVTYQFFRVIGSKQDNGHVENVRFKGLTFRYADWKYCPNTAHWWDPYEPECKQDRRNSFRIFNETNNADPRQAAGAVPQAAHNMPGSIHFEYAKNCSLDDCKIKHIGFHGVDVRRGCSHIRIVGNTIRDLGGGAVNIDGTDCYGDQRDITGWNSVCDNTISSTGWVYPGACGILSCYSFKNVIMHNEIFDTTYSGISVGWMWGFTESNSYAHRIEKNHIYNIGCRGDLSDMGGIYVLGFQPGTFIRNNLIHNISMSAYGGWGLYTDEGSSGLTIENNIVYDTATETGHEHMSRANIWRNNILAFSELAGVNFNCAVRKPIVARGVWYDFPPEDHTFINNIVVTEGKPMFRDGFKKHEKMGKNLRSDVNLFWDYEKGEDAVIHKLVPPLVEEKETCIDEYREMGWELNSIVADPKFKDATNRDFSLEKDSPAYKIGFVDIDMSDVGPRKEEDRGFDF